MNFRKCPVCGNIDKFNLSSTMLNCSNCGCEISLEEYENEVRNGVKNEKTKKSFWKTVLDENTLDNGGIKIEYWNGGSIKKAFVDISGKYDKKAYYLTLEFSDKCFNDGELYENDAKGNRRVSAELKVYETKTRGCGFVYSYDINEVGVVGMVDDLSKKRILPMVSDEDRSCLLSLCEKLNGLSEHTRAEREKERLAFHKSMESFYEAFYPNVSITEKFPPCENLAPKNAENDNKHNDR